MAGFYNSPRRLLGLVRRTTTRARRCGRRRGFLITESTMSNAPMPSDRQREWEADCDAADQRCRDLTDSFAEASRNTTFAGVVKFAFDDTEPDSPWQVWVGEECTWCDSFNDAYNCAIDSLREAADVLEDLE